MKQKPASRLRQLKDIHPAVLAWCAVVLAWFNLLPYLSRLPRGLEWVTKILPDGSGFSFLLGLVFFQAVYSMPAYPLIKASCKSGRATLPRLLILGIVSVFIWYGIKDVDLCCDPNAAVALPSIMFVAMGIAYGLLALQGRFSREQPIDQTDEEKLKAALKRATDAPGWLGRKNSR